ncbi:MAG: hypothetical protein ACKO8Q_08080, partial [Bacteroidota bacterium]
LPVAVWEESEIFYVVEDNCVRFEEPVEVEVYNSLGQLIESCTTKELILNRKGVSFICFRRASYSWKVFPIIRF